MTQKTATPSRPVASPANRNRKPRTGFTLIELAVALTIILLIVSMVVPTLTKMLSSRASMEAYNLVAAQLTSARAEAITSDTFAGIHVQLGEQDDMQETAYSMIIKVSDAEILQNSPKFTRHPAFIPQELPGGTALGKLTSDFVKDQANPPAGTEAAGEYINMTDARVKEFCAFSIVFTPDGTVSTRPKGSGVQFDPSDPTFASGDTQLWDFGLANNRVGVTAFTMFNLRKLMTFAEPSEREDYLDENGQFLPINMHTGQMFDRK
jgi:prepilin-type N-terminal cleavage/methylation domain-containing protein